MAENKNENSSEMEIQRNYEVKSMDLDMASITDFNTAMEQAQAVWGTAVTADETLGDGFALISDKTAVVDIPFIIVDASWAHGDYGPFWSLRVVTEQGSKFVFNDGSTGIAAQMDMLLKRFGSKDGKRVGGVLVKHGLTYSDYTYVDEKTGKESPARTFYLSTSA